MGAIVPSRPLGFATVSILNAIKSGRRYGIEIMDETGLGGGTIYKLLHRLEEKRLIAGVWENAKTAEREKRPRRRYYELTREGTAALADALRQYGELAKRGAEAAGRGARQRGGPGAPLHEEG
jgi:DNA-binding PadR family transcriptional regulator